MANSNSDISTRKAAVISGSALLLMAIAAGFAYGFVHGTLIVPGEAAKTAANIEGSQLLFRLGNVGFLIVLILDIVVAWGLYLILKPVNKGLSLFTAWLRLVYTAFLGLGLMNLLFVTLLLRGDAYLSQFDPGQLNSLVQFCLNGFTAIWSAGLVVFGFHLLFLGWLVFKSGYIPKFLAILLFIAAAGYIGTNTASMVLHNYADYQAAIETVLSLPMALGELALAVWLLYKGIRGTLIS